MLVAVLFAVERLHEHSQDRQAMSVAARLFGASKVGAVPMHKMNLCVEREREIIRGMMLFQLAYDSSTIMLLCHDELVVVVAAAD